MADVDIREVSSQDTEWWYYSHWGNPDVFSHEDTVYTNDTSKLKSGGKTPNYFKRVANHELIPHQPFTHETFESQSDSRWSTTYASYNTVAPYEKVNEWELTANGPWFSATLFEEVRNMVREHSLTITPNPQRFIQLAAAQIANQGFDVSTFVAEAGHLVKLFDNIGERLVELIRQIGWYRLANFWLEYRYAWRPILYDLRNLYEAIYEFSGSSGSILSESIGTDVRDRVIVDTPYVNHTHVGYFRSITTYAVGIRGNVSAKIHTDIPRFSTDPIDTLWEATRLSFVVDWLIDIGTWLNSLDLPFYSQDVTSSSGFKIEVTNQTNLHLTGNQVGTPGWPANQDILNSDVFAESSWKFILSQRTPTPIPVLPLIPLNINLPKTIDLLALLYQAARR